MNRRRVIAVALVAGLLAIGARPAVAAESTAYDDPGMHFAPPDGWQRLPVPTDSADPGLSEKKTLAAYTFAKGRNDTRILAITAQPFDNGLDAAEKDHEADLRDQSDATRIDHKTRTTLPNGMPVWFISVFQGSDPFTSAQLYQYVVFDGYREIIVSYSGHQGQFKADDALHALESLYVVVYPKHRRA